MQNAATKAAFVAEPFMIGVGENVLDDLRLRLDRTRWPNEPKGRAWGYGVDLTWMKQVAHHWRHRYDWRAWEARLNRFPNFHALLDGKRIHFLLERGSGPNPLPLLLTHGWPGSVAEFIDVIEPLAHPERFGGDPRDSFTVVVPSLPGFGFSDPPDAPTTARAIAGLWSRLMRDVLDYGEFVAQGGDWGALVASWLALEHPRGLRALHLNSSGLAGGVDRAHDPSEPLSAEEIAWQQADAARRHGIMAYQQILGTEPQTLAYGLTDSPAGLAAWILQRFHTWTVRGSEGPPPFNLDHLLTNVMLYWLSGINSPNWLYVSIVDGTVRRIPSGRKVEIPTGFMLCPSDNTVPPPTRWLARVFANIVHRNDANQGGHFLAFEQGPLFVEEVRGFFRRFR